MSIDSHVQRSAAHVAEWAAVGQRTNAKAQKRPNAKMEVRFWAQSLTGLQRNPTLALNLHIA